jgi:hypothetical protein
MAMMKKSGQEMMYCFPIIVAGKFKGKTIATERVYTHNKQLIGFFKYYTTEAPNLIAACFTNKVHT